MKVYVIMGNDYPECVYAKKTDADAYVEDKKREQKKMTPEQHGSRIYWRSYEFELIR